MNREPFEYFQWREREKDFPCLFAKAIRRHLGPAVHSNECTEHDPDKLAQEIENKIAGAVRAGAKVVSIHVPAWKGDEPLVARTFVALASLPGWSLLALSPAKQGDGHRVGLHRLLQSASERSLEVETVPMVLGTFPHLPSSRRCPEPILELALDAEASAPRKGKLRCDFLRLPLTKLDAAQFDRFSKKVKQAVRQVNGGNDDRAHPDVTFTFTPTLSALLNH